MWITTKDNKSINMDFIKTMTVYEVQCKGCDAVLEAHVNATSNPDVAELWDLHVGTVEECEKARETILDCYVDGRKHCKIDISSTPTKHLLAAIA